MSVAAIVPVKRLTAGKSRLAETLGREGAERLALAMLGDVIEALRATRGLDVVAVVTPDPEVAAAAERARAPDLEAMLDALAKHPAPAAVLAPARDGGTAALARKPHAAIASRFGAASAEAHRAGARDANAALVELALPSLALDLDDGDDLRAFLATPDGGERTRATLRALGAGAHA